MKLIIAGSRTLSVTPDFIDSTIKLWLRLYRRNWSVEKAFKTP